jgi:hypothetical protein
MPTVISLCEETMHFKRLLIAALFTLLFTSMSYAADYPFSRCLERFGNLTLNGVSYPDADGTVYYGFDIEGGGWLGVYLYTSGDAHIQTYDYQDFWCLKDAPTSDLPSITLYPMGGTHWTWAVQDRYDHWHTVTDKGAIVITPPEYDDAGRLITRLVINRREPTDPARWHIYDEYGNLAG